MIDYDPEDAVSVWPAGDYDATLMKVETGTSKSSGCPMETWTFEVFHSSGKSQTIKEYVVIPAATFKIKQFAVALGKKADFDARKFQAEDYIGSSVVAELMIEESDGFDDKNKIKKVKAVPVNSRAEAPAQRQAVGAGTGGGKPSRAEEPPFGDEQQFKEDDIPF